MTSQYINPRQPIGDFFLSACENPTLTITKSKPGEVISDGQRAINLTTIVEYTAQFVSSIEVPTKPKFSPQYIDNYNTVTRIILNRETQQKNESINFALQHLEQVLSLMRGASPDPYESIGLHLKDYEDSFGRGEIQTQGPNDTVDLVEMGIAVLWGVYRISKGKTHNDLLTCMRQSIIGGLRGAAIVPGYKGFLAGAISSALVVQNFDERDARIVFSNRPRQQFT